MLNQPITVNQIVADAISRYSHKADWLNRKVDGQWQPISAAELAGRIREVVLGLFDLGIRPGERVAILSENRLEWNLVDLGALALGAVDVPIYATQSPSQVEYILRDSGARLLFISTEEQLNRVRQAIDRAPALERVIAFDQISNGWEEVLPYSEIEARGARVASDQPLLYDQLWPAVKPTDLATLIYTSGTTGEPKGVMLTHWNIASNVLAVAGVLNYALDDIALSFLPFSHVFERTAFYTYLHKGVQVYYAESVERVPENLKAVRPTVGVGVPRVFEKIYERIRMLTQEAPPLRRRLVTWAIDVSKRYAERQVKHQAIDPFLQLQYDVAYQLVLSQWRPRLGLDRLRCFISGGAALSPELAYIFLGAGIQIFQGYGLTETSPGVTLNSPAANKIGTVGKVMPGIEVKCADDGEILVRGPNVMLGYYNRPEETRQVLSEDGWFKTGDVGHLEEGGYLVITDRKKDLIKTSGGKYVAPQAIEGRIKLSPFVAEAVVVGNDRKFPAALIVPNLEAVTAYARQHQIPYQQPCELLRDERIVDLFYQVVEELMGDLSRYEKIKKIALLCEPFSVSGGELTPTMKVRRRQVEQRYAHLIEKLYSENSSDEEDR
ncbi:MAG: long-chain fatty acid--CoA ligase [Acidobacteria bacterium]|nr:long-chain fatty acid--CoA ligase [Acidobacteriota bacterium]